jgi:predicted PurR-regulated permease PerM
MQQFRLDRFYRINRRVLIWAAIIGLIYIMRDFFALIFVTFILSSLALPVIDYFQRNTRFPRKWIIVALYLVMFIAFAGVIYYIVPRVTAEASSAARDLYSMQTGILLAKDDIARWYPPLQPILDEYIDEQSVTQQLDELAQKIQPMLVYSAKTALKAISTLALSLLFSFLIMIDLTRLASEVRRLEHSRLHDFYRETAQPVVRFAAVLARSFRALAVIALTNTVLTLIGFLVLGLQKVALLSMIVFFFSFIPVLGVFISTTPAVLVAINTSGYSKAFGVIVLVTIIHMIEAYILNPLIYGRHLKLNPVLVLVILYVGNHFFGLWGMVLGVPVTYYFLYYVFGVPREDGLLEPAARPEPVVVQPAEPRQEEV